jgi:hypothetical protein
MTITKNRKVRYRANPSASQSQSCNSIWLGFNQLRGIHRRRRIRPRFPQLHQKWALTADGAVSNLPPRRRSKGLASIIGRQSKIGRVIRKARRLVERPDPKKPTVLRGSVGVRYCESSDRIKGL